VYFGCSAKFCSPFITGGVQHCGKEEKKRNRLWTVCYGQIITHYEFIINGGESCWANNRKKRTQHRGKPLLWAIFQKKKSIFFSFPKAICLQNFLHCKLTLSLKWICNQIIPTLGFRCNNIQQWEAPDYHMLHNFQSVNWNKTKKVRTWLWMALYAKKKGDRKYGIEIKYGTTHWEAFVWITEPVWMECTDAGFNQKNETKPGTTMLYCCSLSSETQSNF
jgi:hypothetical protein